MVWSHGAGPAGMFRYTRLSPYRLTRQRSMGWAYTSLPPEFSCGEGENCLRSPPVAGVEALTLRQQTTTGCCGALRAVPYRRRVIAVRIGKHRYRLAE